MVRNNGRNHRWEREELILALDLYFEINPYKTNNKDPRIATLSNILKEINLPQSNNLENFRNSNSVYMKMCNFLALDPLYNNNGLKKGGKLDKIIWDEFSSDIPRLKKTAIKILEEKRKIQSDLSFNAIDHEKNKKIFRGLVSDIKNLKRS